jgi:hypothetical protein
MTLQYAPKDVCAHEMCDTFPLHSLVGLIESVSSKTIDTVPSVLHAIERFMASVAAGVRKNFGGNLCRWQVVAIPIAGAPFDSAGLEYFERNGIPLLMVAPSGSDAIIIISKTCYENVHDLPSGVSLCVRMCASGAGTDTLDSHTILSSLVVVGKLTYAPDSERVNRFRKSLCYTPIRVSCASWLEQMYFEDEYPFSHACRHTRSGFKGEQSDLGEFVLSSFLARQEQPLVEIVVGYGYEWREKIGTRYHVNAPLVCNLAIGAISRSTNLNHMVINMVIAVYSRPPVFSVTENGSLDHVEPMFIGRGPSRPYDMAVSIGEQAKLGQVTSKVFEFVKFDLLSMLGVTGSRVIQLGCGSGTDLMKFALLAPLRALLVDKSSLKMTACSQAVLRNQPFLRGIDVEMRKVDFMDEDFNEVFDVVFCPRLMDGMFFQNGDLENVMAKLFSLVSERGSCAMVINNFPLLNYCIPNDRNPSILGFGPQGGLVSIPQAYGPVLKYSPSDKSLYVQAESNGMCVSFDGSVLDYIIERNLGNSIVNRCQLRSNAEIIGFYGLARYRLMIFSHGGNVNRFTDALSLRGSSESLGIYPILNWDPAHTIPPGNYDSYYHAAELIPAHDEYGRCADGGIVVGVRDRAAGGIHWNDCGLIPSAGIYVKEGFVSSFPCHPFMFAGGVGFVSTVRLKDEGRDQLVPVSTCERDIEHVD